MTLTELVQAELAASFSANSPAVSAFRMGTAVILGGVIGFERQLNATGAGLRTHVLVSLAASLFALIAAEMVVNQPEGDYSDPLRLIEAVTSGVAFLAAGSIITSGGQIKGLTTGAGMWMAGAVGLACGMGNLVLAAFAAGIAVFVLYVFAHLSHGINKISDVRDSEPQQTSGPNEE